MLGRVGRGTGGVLSKAGRGQQLSQAESIKRHQYLDTIISSDPTLRTVKNLPIHKMLKRLVTGENMPPVVKRFHTLAQTASGARHRRKMGIHDGWCGRKAS